jgi:hypothetical protein
MDESDDRVEALLRDIRAMDAQLHGIVQEVRAAVHDTAPAVTEKVMYGGIMFADDLGPVGASFCGVFAYRQHVSLEFGKGSDLDDRHGVLEGGGKYRRHIKLRTTAAIEEKHVRDYLRQALALAADNHGNTP